MMRKSTKTGVIARVLLPILFAAGCTGTDVLDPTTGNIKVSLETVNFDPDGPFSDDPVGDPANLIFPDTAFVQIQQVTARPVNPDADSAIGLDLGLLRRPLERNLNVVDTVEADVSLSSATYHLQSLRLNEIFFLNRSDGMGGSLVRPEHIDPNNPTCTDFVRFFIGEDAVELSDFGGDVLISTEANVTTELRITLDADALIDAYTEAWNCEPCNCPALYDPADPSTFSCQCFATSFNSVDFRNRTQEFLSFP